MANDVPKLQLAGFSILPEDSDAFKILDYVLRNELAFNGAGLKDFTTGNKNAAGNYALPAQTSQENQDLGRRYVLATVGCKNIRALLQSYASGPAMWQFITHDLLGGRDVQALIQEFLEQLKE